MGRADELKFVETNFKVMFRALHEVMFCLWQSDVRLRRVMFRALHEVVESIAFGN